MSRRQDIVRTDQRSTAPNQTVEPKGYLCELNQLFTSYWIKYKNSSTTNDERPWILYGLLPIPTAYAIDELEQVHGHMDTVAAAASMILKSRHQSSTEKCRG